MADDPNADLIGYVIRGHDLGGGNVLTVLKTTSWNPAYVEVEVTSREDKPVTVRPAALVRQHKLSN